MNFLFVGPPARKKASSRKKFILKPCGSKIKLIKQITCHHNDIAVICVVMLLMVRIW
jgi:hypothetical protein